MGVLNTTPRTWVTSETVTAAEMNTEIRDAITTMQAAWTSYTPTTTGITLGNGTVAGRYNQVGKTIDFTVAFTLGSTSAITATPTFTMPVTAKTSNWSSTDCNAFDTSATSWFPAVAIATSTTVITVRTGGATGAANYVVMSSTVPFTWAVGDVLSLSGRYEAA